MPSVAWLEADGSSLVVAPLVALDPGGVYTIATSAPLVSMPFTVSVDAPPALARVWPDPTETTPSASAAVWCGQADLGAIDAPATLEPALLAGRFVRGTGAPFPVPQCVAWLSGPLAADPDAMGKPDSTDHKLRRL